MLDISRIIKSHRQIQALTGLSMSKLDILSQTFAKISKISVSKKNRKRQIGGGRKGSLESPLMKLFFILFYMKVYPTYDLASAIFSVDRSQVCRWVKRFLPILEETLGVNYSLPKRKVSSFQELFNNFPLVNDLFMDGVERRINRPKNNKNQRKSYSGKKKCHTRKNTLICDEDRRILYVSPTKNGKIHDFNQAQKEQLFDNIPKEICLWVDKGYQGIKKVMPPDQVQIPHKKPKGENLTSKQKEENKIISGIRIVVEHAIGGVKRFGCMSQQYRNRSGQDNQMIGICSGLWNFHLQNS